MPRSVKDSYELSRHADADLEDIYEYTVAEFGEHQTIRYLTALEDVFEQLVATPGIGRVRDEIRPGLRSFPKGEHVIFYRILKTRIRVVRVLHGSRDLPNFL